MKKFRVLKPGIFLQANNRHMTQIRPLIPMPVGEIVELLGVSAQVKTGLKFGQLELVGDDEAITFTAA